MTQNVLIATNGFKGTWPSIEYGTWLASTLNTNVTLLGVNEKPNPAAIDDHNPLEDVFEAAVELFQKNGVKYELLVENGNAEDVIPQWAKQRDSIVVLGPLGRPQIRRLLTGRSIRHLMEEIEQPILYVPEATLPLKKILICIAASYMQASQSVGSCLNAGLQGSLPKQVCFTSGHGQHTKLHQVQVSRTTAFAFFFLLG